MNKEKHRELNRLYRLNNKDKIKEINRLYRLNNKDKIKEVNRLYRLNNKDKIKEINRLYCLNNKHIKRSHCANRRSLKLKSTPKFANLNKIREVYKNCPKGYVVDHIVPLQGKLVCGLHVEWNLQYLTPSENSSKSNRLI